MISAVPALVQFTLRAFGVFIYVKLSLRKTS